MASEQDELWGARARYPELAAAERQEEKAEIDVAADPKEATPPHLTLGLPPGLPSGLPPAAPPAPGELELSGPLTRALVAFDRPERGLGGPELIALACLINTMGVVEWLHAQTPALSKRTLAPLAAGGRDNQPENALAPIARLLGNLDLSRLTGILNLLGLGGSGGGGKEGGGGDGRPNLASIVPLLGLLLSDQGCKRKETDGTAFDGKGAAPARQEEPAPRGPFAQLGHGQPGRMDYRVSERRSGLRKDA